MALLVTKIRSKNNNGVSETRDIGVQSNNIIGNVADWNETDSSSPAYISNKPDIPTILQENSQVKQIKVGSSTYKVACRSTASGNVIQDKSDGYYLGISSQSGNLIENKSDGLFANLNPSYEAQNETLTLCQ